MPDHLLVNVRRGVAENIVGAHVLAGHQEDPDITGDGHVHVLNVLLELGDADEVLHSGFTPSKGPISEPSGFSRSHSSMAVLPHAQAEGDFAVLHGEVGDTVNHHGQLTIDSSPMGDQPEAPLLKPARQPHLVDGTVECLVRSAVLGAGVEELAVNGPAEARSGLGLLGDDMAADTDLGGHSELVVDGVQSIIGRSNLPLGVWSGDDDCWSLSLLRLVTTGSEA